MLNTEQMQAATAPLNKSILVIAGAGSGKTAVLTNRVVHLYKNNVSPSSILAVTFTNKASKEMKTRLDKSGVPTNQMMMGTFHALGYKIIRSHYQELGYQSSLAVMDTQDQISFFKKSLKKNDIDPKTLDVEDIIAQINMFKEGGKRVADVKKSDPYLGYYKIYEDEAKQLGVLDFAELLLGSFELLKMPHIHKHYASKFTHVLVDEFQDTNLLQYAWLLELTDIHKNVFVVGDFDQSIYGFRGAYPQNLFRVKDDFPNIMEVKLEQNYRSLSFILEAANSVIENNSQRQPKNLWTAQKDNGRIVYKHAYNDFEEVMYVGDHIQALHRSGVDYKDIAILYRTNALSRNFEKAFMSRGIPFTIYGGLRFFERQEVKNAIAYLRLVNNFNDDLAFARIVNVPARGVGDTTVDKLYALSKLHKVSLIEAVEFLPVKTKVKLDAFVLLIKNMATEIKGKTLKEQVAYVVDYCGLKELYENKSESERIDNLYELVSAAKVFELENPSAVLQDFFNSCQLDGDFDKIQQNKHLEIDNVQLMTVHSAKGLEFEHVFLVGLNEQIFPHERCIGKAKEVEEERRLMYVAITRARKQLFFTSCESRIFHGTGHTFVPSRFIYEIPERLIAKVR